MSKLLWHILKATPAVLGSSLFFANSAFAAQSPSSGRITLSSALRWRTLTTTPTQTSNSKTAAKDKVNAALSSDLSSKASYNLADSTLSQATQPGGAAPSESEVLEQIQRYSGEGNSLNQVNSITQFSDVSPDDWAYQALRNLVERYGCIAGYPDGTFRGNRALTRYEFAAGLNSCLQQIERLIVAEESEEGTAVAPEDLETLQRLAQEFQAELATLGTRVDNLGSRLAFVEENQFSTTTKLNGEVIFAISDVFGGDEVVTPDGDTTEIEENTVFQDRVRLNFDTSFTGEDLLRVRLQAANVQDFPELGEVTNEGRLGFAGDNQNDVEIDDLFYTFPFGDAIEVSLAGHSTEIEDLIPVLNPVLQPSGTGAISNFGRLNPIYNMGGQSAGATFTFSPEAPISISGGYLAGEPANPDEGNGFAGGSYAAFGQLTFQPSERFQVAATYVNSYSEGLNHGTGSIGSLVRVGEPTGDPDNPTNIRPVVGNSYGVEVSFGLTEDIILSGWGGYTDAIILGRGNAEVWNYAGTLAIQDFGTPGSTLGFVVGMEPRLTESDVADLEVDEDTGLHVEAFYKLQLSDNVSITPGVIWLTAPGHNDENDDVFVSTVRTTFSF